MAITSMVEEQKKIQTLQNQLLKILSNQSYYFSTNKLQKDFNLLKIEGIAKQFFYKTFVHNTFSNS